MAHLRFARALQLSAPQTRLLYQLAQLAQRLCAEPQPTLSAVEVEERIRLLLSTHCTERPLGAEAPDAAHLLPALYAIAPPSQPPPQSPVAAVATPTSTRPSTAKRGVAAAPRPSPSPRPSSSSARAKPGTGTKAADPASLPANAAAVAEADGAEATAAPPPPPPPAHFLTPTQCAAVSAHLHSRVLRHLPLLRAAWRRGSDGLSGGDGLWEWRMHRAERSALWLLPLDGAVEAPLTVTSSAGGAEEDDALHLHMRLSAADCTAAEWALLQSTKAELEFALQGKAAAVTV